MRYLIFVKWLTVFLAVGVLAGVGVWIGTRGCSGKEGSAASASSSALSNEIPKGWKAAPVEKTAVIENPLRKSKAAIATAGFPPGSEVVEVETNGEPAVRIGILPDGRVVTEEGHDAVVYIKRPSLFGLEARPWIGAGVEGRAAGVGIAAAAGLDVVRFGRFHGGPAAAVTWGRKDEEGKRGIGVAGGIAGAFNLTRNIDLRGGAVYGTDGAAGFVVADVAIVEPKG